MMSQANKVVHTAAIQFGISMLQQVSKGQSNLAREPLAPETTSGAEALVHLVSFVRRQFYLISFVVVLTTVLAVIYLYTTQPVFTAKAQLMIDTRKVQIFQQQSILGDIPIDAAQVESQVEVLKSENIAAAVIKKLHLTEDPGFVGSGGGILGALYKATFGESRLGNFSEYELSRHVISAFQSRLKVRRIGLTYVIEISFDSYSGKMPLKL